MKIVFVIESFFPSTQGGSEWSTYYLAKELVELGYDVTLITPNLGAKHIEINHGIKIIRYPFYLKHFKTYSNPSNLTYNNPLWIIWSAIFMFFYIMREKADIIHVHGKYSIPSANLANLFLRKKLIVTIRDFQVICNYGFCIYKKNKACNLVEYWKSDFAYYWRNYVTNKNILSFIFNVIFAISGRINRNILKYFACHSLVVVLSKKQKKIFEANGFKNIEIIGNSINFSTNPPYVKKHNQIVYAGRLTPGKGVLLLINLLPKFFIIFPKYNFLFVGDGFLKEKIKILAKQYRGIKLIDQVAHKKLLKILAKSKLTVIPSVWPEPFGRIPMESLSQKTPVVVSNNGALPEHIKEGKWGYIAEANTKDLLFCIAKAIKNIDDLQVNINNDFGSIKRKFSYNISKKYIKIYNKII